MKLEMSGPEKAVSSNPLRHKMPLKERCHGYENERHRRRKRNKVGQPSESAVFLYLSTGGHKDTGACHSGGPGLTG